MHAHAVQCFCRVSLTFASLDRFPPSARTRYVGEDVAGIARDKEKEGRHVHARKGACFPGNQVPRRAASHRKGARQVGPLFTLTLSESLTSLEIFKCGCHFNLPAPRDFVHMCLLSFKFVMSPSVFMSLHPQVLVENAQDGLVPMSVCISCLALHGNHFLHTMARMGLLGGVLLYSPNWHVCRLWQPVRGQSLRCKRRQNPGGCVALCQGRRHAIHAHLREWTRGMHGRRYLQALFCDSHPRRFVSDCIGDWDHRK